MLNLNAFMAPSLSMSFSMPNGSRMPLTHTLLWFYSVEKYASAVMVGTFHSTVAEIPLCTYQWGKWHLSSQSLLLKHRCTRKARASYIICWKTNSFLVT